MSENPHKIIPEFKLNWSLARDMLVRFIETEVKRAGFSRVVVGLSGGIDSALSTYLAVQALGSNGVCAYQMPYRTSNPDSSAHAQEMSEVLDISLDTVDITPMADSFFAVKPNADEIRRGNVMARLRMITLFDAAMEKDALVLGTGNKTEILLGYTTIYGDNACSLNPIGDLYKTQVWAMSAHFDLPAEIIAKTPSADLWMGQTDEDELGISYETADEILYRLIDLRLSIEEVAAQGFDERKIQLAAERVKKYQFKRMMPLVPNLSSRMVGGDFLYARDWGT